ncbi:MauE/DoxX family redox-associated membrane protein [Paenibacillus puerhi]|uniref:MauE/DoxX family redox-associated membrane protein n=1 Tax=Paenibacillus puerhi TaxID=2692622 RepID=UPI00135BEE87|nr:MauE/DoxX family redox-associated membrane protein [Paenibacillus puerhi]
MDKFNYLLTTLFSLVFFVSSISKIYSFKEFTYAIYDFEIFGKNKRLIVFYGVVGLILEIIFALCFSLGIFLKLIFILCILQLIFFTACFYRMYLKKLKIKCNCFGKSDKNTDIKLSICRNVLLIVLAFIGYLTNENDLGVGFFSLNRFFICSILALSYQVYIERKVMVNINS